MNQLIAIACEQCGSKSTIVMQGHTDADGKRIEWPKAAVKADGMYFTIACPACGEREQCVARPGDTE